MTAPDSSLSPGFGAFVVFFLLAVVLYLLMRSMGGHLRRLQYRQEEQAREDLGAQDGADLGAQDGAPADDGSPGQR